MELTVVLPDYGNVVLKDEKIHKISVPSWVGQASLRVGIAPELGEVWLVKTPELVRPHPYVDSSGEGWVDNHRRFFSFSAAVASIVEEVSPDVLHLNDWHTAMTLAFTDVPSVYTIHTLGYQGHADIEWLRTISTDRAAAYERFGEVNPAAGAIRLADKVVAVSPNYAAEILDPSRGSGLHTLLASKGDDLVGIRNGIDTSLWDPLTDPFLTEHFDESDLDNKQQSTAELLALAGWEIDDGPVIGVVSRLVEQKGMDMLFALAPYLEGMGTRLFVLGSGEERLAIWGHELAAAYPDTVHFVDAYDLKLAHLIFAGADLFVMPSRFEPCGLAQMQAMEYGTIPVVTPVGGLVDTVIDADAHPRSGTGFVSLSVDGLGILDALHRAVSAWRSKKRRAGIQKRGMSIDWSWDEPTRRHIELYEEVVR